MRTRLPSLAALLALLAACGGSASPAPTHPTAPTAPAKPAPPPAPPPPPAAPLTARDQLDWVIATITTRHGAVDKAEIEARYAPSFLREVPVEQVIAITAELAKQVPDLAIASAQGDAYFLVAHLTSKAGKLRAEITLDRATRKITGLLFQPELDQGPPLASYADADARAKTIAFDAQLYVADLDHGTCKPRHALAEHDELAIGSTFKLYILLAVADQIIAGKLQWDDPIAIRDDWKSLPSGITQNDAEGTKLTVRELAERMISISDNTAADHLLYTVGRRAVEKALVEAKHSHPALDTPFLSTRELFLIKLALTPDEVAKYLKMSSAQRRTYLDKTLAGRKPSIDGAADWKAARHIDQLEWFASADDLCHVMATLWSRAQDPKAAALLDVLAKNPGVPIDKTVFPYVGYKGGSEPGVLNMTYLLRRDDQRWFVVELGFNTAAGGAVDEDRAIGLAPPLIQLVGKDR